MMCHDPRPGAAPNEEVFWQKQRDRRAAVSYGIARRILILLLIHRHRRTSTAICLSDVANIRRDGQPGGRWPQIRNNTVRKTRAATALHWRGMMPWRQVNLSIHRSRLRQVEWVGDFIMSRAIA